MRTLPLSYIFIIPIRLDSSNIPYEDLRELHYIDLFPNWEQGFKKLLIAMDMNLDIGKKIMEVYFDYDNIESAYTKAIDCISHIEFSKITDEERNISIKASLGSHLLARVIGYAVSDSRLLRVDVSIKFREKKITVYDKTGFGLKWPAEGKIIKNMREKAIMIKECIENKDI